MLEAGEGSFCEGIGVSKGRIMEGMGKPDYEAIEARLKASSHYHKTHTYVEYDAGVFRMNMDYALNDGEALLARCRELEEDCERLRGRTHELQERHDKELKAEVTFRKYWGDLLEQANTMLKESNPEAHILIYSANERSVLATALEQRDKALAEIERVAPFLAIHGMGGYSVSRMDMLASPDIINVGEHADG